MSAAHGTVFLSRSGQDIGAVLPLIHGLEAAGFRVLVQDTGIKTGEDFTAFMDHALRTAEATVALISSEYLASEWCRREARAADGLANHRLIPLVIEEGCQPDGLLASLVYCDVTALFASQPSQVATLVSEILKSGKPIAEAPAARPYIRQSIYVTNISFNDQSVFMGRDKALIDLDGALWRGHGAAAITQAAAVHGLGGIGKTTLAIEYASQNRHRYRGVWRLRGEQASTLEQDLASLHRRLVPDAPVMEPRDAARAAIDVVERTPGRPFLFLFDNIETPDAMKNWWPSTGAQVLITSRWRDWRDSKALPIALETLLPEAAVNMLLALCGRDDKEAAGKLAEKLGFLPLALSHAAAVLRQARALTFDDYARTLDARIAALPKGAGEYPAAVRGAIESNLAMLARDAPDAHRLLDFAAFCAPDAIPLKMWDTDTAKQYLPPSLQDGAQQADALGALETWSLISTSEVGGTNDSKSLVMSLHRLTQAVIRARCVEAGNHAWIVGETIDALMEMIGDDPHPPSWRLEIVNPHAIAVADHVMSMGGADGQSYEEQAAALVARTTFRCSFCGKSRYDSAVAKLIMGPVGGICDGCTFYGDEMIAEALLLPIQFGRITPAGRHLQRIPPRNSSVYCLFCGKAASECAVLLQFDNMRICNECVELCLDILEEEGVKINRRAPRSVVLAAKVSDEPERRGESFDELDDWISESDVAAQRHLLQQVLQQADDARAKRRKRRRFVLSVALFAMAAAAAAATFVLLR